MFHSVFILKIAVAVLALVVVVMFSDQLATFGLNRTGMGTFVELASVLIVFQAVFAATNSTLIGLGRMNGASLMMIAQAASRGVAAPLLIMLGFSVTGAIIGHVLGFVVGGCLGLVAVVAGFPGMLHRGLGAGSLRSLRTALAYGFPLYAVSLLSVFLSQYQNIVLAWFVSNVEIGNFNAASNVSAAINLVSFPIVTVLFPAFARIKSHSGGEELRTMFSSSIRQATLLLMPSTMFVMVFSRDLVRTIYGRSFTSASSYLTMYAGVFLLVAVGYLILTPVFNGIGENRETLKMMLATVGMFLPLAPVMTLLYAVNGLIIALIASSLVGTLYGLHRAMKKVGLKPDLEASLRIFLASAASTLLPLLFLSTVNISSVVNIVVGGFIYLAAYLTLAPLIGAVKRSDIGFFSQTFAKTTPMNRIIEPILAYETRLLDSSLGRRINGER